MNQTQTRLLTVLSVDQKSPAKKCGLCAGDKIVSVNDTGIKDEFDFRFNAACDKVRIVVVRKNGNKLLCMDRSDNALLGIRFVQPPLRKCGNKCIFCFVDQMPKGLRKSLYIKDEDLGHSFTNGNYVTLSTTPGAELARVAKLGMSPLFVSVHATNNAVRRALLCNDKAYDIMEQLRFGATLGLMFHTQIVVCPGHNDGAVLSRSIRDLLSLRHGLLSVAVVPVGLTMHRKHMLAPVDKVLARSIVQMVSALGDSDAKRNGFRRVFCADEIFIKAGLVVPQKSYYEDYPQIENGVGLVRQLLNEWARIKREYRTKPWMTKRGQRKTLVVTSESASVFMKRIIADCNVLQNNNAVELCIVKNKFFGGHVSVAGLLTASDIVKATKQVRRRFDSVVVPHVIFNYQGFTLDGYSMRRMEKQIGAPLHVADSLRSMVSYL